MSALSIRPARPDQAGLILDLLGQFAAFEKLPFLLTEGDVARDFFGPAAVIGCDLAFDGDAPAGLVTWYWTYASFRAARRLFVEDLYVQPQYRGRGHGTALLRHLAAKAKSLGAARLEWQVLDWNAPAIFFYESIGARRHDGWSTYWLENLEPPA